MSEVRAARGAVGLRMPEVRAARGAVGLWMPAVRAARGTLGLQFRETGAEAAVRKCMYV
ncbi:MAG: hypothetical protein PUH86_06910 [Lachnospiraceae bacterium]|nr:hypothetical protein [Lachnospiraceae bacterium]